MKIIRKTGVSTLINVLGMSVAFATAMILMVQVRWDATYDRGFKGHEKVFRMENNWMDGGLYAAYFNRKIIELARTASPNVEAVGTLMNLGGSAVYYPEGDRESAVSIPSVRVDSSMFSVFPFEWIEGSPKDFQAKGTAVIDETFARMLYGDESPVGKLLRSPEAAAVRIIGVFRTTPRNFSMHFGLLESLGDRYLDEDGEWSFTPFIKLKDPSLAKETEETVANSVIEFMGGFLGDRTDQDMAETFRKGFRLRNLHSTHFARDVRANFPSVSKAVTVTLAAIALLLIFIALINFINFAFAEIPFRIKNINTRKVLGEGRGSLIRKQLIHAGAIALSAFALAALLMHAVSGTSWASFVSDSLKLGDNPGILAVTFAIALVSAVAAGIAPALYSTAQPAALVLKGSYGTGVKGRSLRNSLVAMQYVLSFVFIIMALYIGVQTRFMMGRDMGFPQENILQVWCGYIAGGQHEALEGKLLSNPAIAEVTFADNMIVSDQKMGWGRTADDGKQIFMEVLPVSDNFVRFFGLHVTDGRDFQPSDNQSENGCFIANENFISKFPQFRVGSFLGGHEGDTEIVGIVKDFNFKSLQHPMEPLMLLNWGRNQWRNFSVMYVKMTPGADFKEVSDYVKAAVCDFDPSREPDQVNVRHLDEWIESMYQSEQSLGKLITAASLIALLIAVIGIIGLVFFETQFIRKEIAVRRVNGATVGSILQMINRIYLIMAAVSFVIAAPAATWIITVWRKGFAYQAPVPAWIYLAALALVTAITLAVVTLQSWRAASANPVESIKIDS